MAGETVSQLNERTGCYPATEAIELLRSRKGWRGMALAEIQLAHCPDGWRGSIGFGFSSGDHWGSWSPVSATQAPYADRTEALADTIERLRDRIKGRDCTEANAIRRWLDGLIPEQADILASERAAA